MDEDELVPIILGRPFLATARVVIDVHEGKLSLRVGNETVTFNIGKSMRSTYFRDDYLYCADHTAKLIQEKQEQIEPLEWKALENRLKPSITEPPKLELKELPEHLEYAFLQGNDQLPIVIYSVLFSHEKTKLLENPPYKFKWTEKTVPVAKGSSKTTTEWYMENYKNVSQNIRNQLDAEAEAVQIILTRIDNDIYSTVDACPNAFYHPQHHPTQFTQNSSTRSQQATTRNRGKAIVNSPQPIYDQEPSIVDEDDETSKDKEIDKLMALISLSFKKIYKPTNNNLRTSSNTSRANQDNSPRINRSDGYENQRNGNVAGAWETVGSSVEEARIQLNAEQADWRDDTNDDELEDQELEAHYMYMAQLQEVSLDAADFGTIFDGEPVQKVLNDYHYNVLTHTRY
nr:hypothetical protein [Tanacetum cinerariifolium]